MVFTCRGREFLVTSFQPHSVLSGRTPGTGEEVEAESFNNKVVYHHVGFFVSCIDSHARSSLSPVVSVVVVCV